MMAELKDEKFERLVRKMDPRNRLLRVWELTGGVSAQVTALEIMHADGQLEKLIVRRHGAVDLAQNPHIATDEFKLLKKLKAEGVPAPRPLFVDESGEIFSTPYLVVEYIEGEAEFAPMDMEDYIQQCAENLARIHRIDNSNRDLSFLPNKAEQFAEKFRERPMRTDESLDEARIREVCEAVGNLPQVNKSVLLHGDYWPGNLLWRDGQLVGIIDWEDAAPGDPLADIGNTRLEMLWAFGYEAMDNFTRLYGSITGIDFTYLPYWDLFAALKPVSKIEEWGAGYSKWKRDVTVKTMREGHSRFVAQALEKLAVR